MKQLYDNTSQSVEQLLAQVRRWPLALQHLHQRLATFFARPEPRHHALLYLQAILSDIPRKNGWQIAEQARQSHPYGMQRLLSHAVWDQDGCRDELRRTLVQLLQPHPPQKASMACRTPFPLLVLDESGFPKRGTHSAGVAAQYCGVTGRVDNCQVGVFASYVTKRGHGLIDRELYLPESWCEDPARRQQAHIPDTVRFATKPELAQRMVQRALDAQVPLRWVVADTVYGHSPQLRTFLEQQHLSYALAVPSIEVVSVQTKEGVLTAEVARLADHVPPQHWHQLSASLGSKGERLFDWAMLPLVVQGQVDGRHFLVFRRCLDDPAELSYYLVWAPAHTPLLVMAQAIGARWHIEEDLHLTKKLGLDQYEVRSYLGWYRHITLVLLAAAFLLGLCLPQTSAGPASAHDLGAEPPPELIPLTPWEVQHLLARLIFPPPTSPPLLCAWSYWRRHHQYIARSCHHRRRPQTTGSSGPAH